MKKTLLDSMLTIGIQLSTQREHSKIFELMISESMNITNADAGTLYTVDNGELHFQIMRNQTMKVYKGGNDETINLPNVPMEEGNVCAYAAIHGELVNIENVYASNKFDFGGPKKYDAITGYKTTSMLVVPLRDNTGEILGVVQLINALDDETGEVIPFDPSYERVLMAIGAQAAITLKNRNYMQDMKKLLYSFVSVISIAIDARTPYNVNHTKNLVEYMDELIDYISAAHLRGETELSFSKSHKEELLLAAWLHDIGKLVTPTRVVNKATRLGEHYDTVMDRLRHIKAIITIEGMRERGTEQELNRRLEEIDDIAKFISSCNEIGFMDKAALERVDELAQRTYLDIDNVTRSWFTDYEIECLHIVKGSLTDNERNEMNNHVVMTGKMLKELRFPEDMKDIPQWASAHHEFINGTGYPNGLTGEQLTTESKMLTVLDILEALKAKDRPYKKELPPEIALRILREMVGEGKLDGSIVDLVEKSGIWRK